MADDHMQFHISADTGPLKQNLREVEDMFSQLDRAIGQNAQSIARTLSQLISGQVLPQSMRGKRSALEQLTAPLINQVLSGVLGSRMQNNSEKPVNIAMNIATPDVNSFRMSQGQILAETAAAIARATKRYL